MIDEPDLSAATAKADAARQRLTATLVDIQARLNPRSLVREAVEELRDTGVEMFRAGLGHVRRHPGPLIGIAATIAAYVARDWFSANTNVPDDDLRPSPLAEAPSRSKIKADPKPPPRRKRP